MTDRRPQPAGSTSHQRARSLEAPTNPGLTPPRVTRSNTCCLRASSRMRIIPPLPVTRSFIASNDQTPISPNVPYEESFHRPPRAQAESSIRTTFRALASSAMSAIQSSRPPKWSNRMALVREVSAFSTCSGRGFNVNGSTSIRRKPAPEARIAWAAPMKLIVGSTTSIDGSSSRAATDWKRPSVQLVTAIMCSLSAPMYAAKAFSKAFTFGPGPGQSSAKTSAIAESSSCPSVG